MTEIYRKYIYQASNIEFMVLNLCERLNVLWWWFRRRFIKFERIGIGR